MIQSKITQANVHVILPSKIAQLADRLLKNGVAHSMAEALHIVYNSPVYANLERESTKYWWQGIGSLYYELESTMV